jgi:signal transduction histidine kinase
MRHRVRALGGRLDIRSSSAGGTSLLAQIPLANALLEVSEAAPI